MSLIAWNVSIYDQVLTKKGEGWHCRISEYSTYLHPDHGVDILAEIKHSVNTLLAQVREVRKEPT